MTTGPLSSCELPLTNRNPNDLTEAFPPLSSIIYLEIVLSPKKCGKKHGGFPFLRSL